MSKIQAQRHIAGWLADLADLTAGRLTIEDLEPRVAQMSAALVIDFPTPHPFNAISLRAVAGGSKFFPSYAEVKERLERWIADQNPAPWRNVAPDEPNLEASDRSMIVFWSEFCSGARALPDGVTLSSWLSMCRQSCPKAFAYLARHDKAAAEICVRKRWEIALYPGIRRADPDEDEMARVRRTVEEAIRVIAQSGAPARRGAGFAAHPMSMTGLDQMQAEHAQAVAAFEKKHGRKPGQLSRDAVEAARAADPLVQRARAMQAQINEERTGQPGADDPAR